MQAVLPKSIHHTQHAFIKGGSIIDVIRAIEDALENTERYGINGKMIAVDFQRAFDSVNKRFLHRALYAFNFSPLLYNGYIPFARIFQAVSLIMVSLLDLLTYKEV